MRFQLKKASIILVTLVAVCGCSTFSKTKNSGTRWAATGIATSAGMAIGAATAPEGDNALYHGFGWAAVFGLTAALVGEIFFNDSAEIDELNEKIKNLEDQAALKPKLRIIDQGGGRSRGNFDGTDGGEKRPWTIYKTDVWIQEGPNRKSHQDMFIEFHEGKSK